MYVCTGYSIREFHYLSNLALNMFSNSLLVSAWRPQAWARPGVTLCPQGLYLEVTWAWVGGRATGQSRNVDEVELWKLVQDKEFK